MRVLVITKIFPNSVEPLSSPFNRQQFSALSRLCELDVLATIPWFPGARAFRRWSRAGQLAAVPSVELVDGMKVRHPRVFYVPKIGHGVAGALYAASLMPQAVALRGEVDVVLGSWAYPDGYAAVLLAELIGAPVVIKVHGSDLDVVAKLSGPARRLRSALPRATRVVTVSRPLAEGARALGVDPARIDIVPNGVDQRLFRVRDRRAARRELGLDPNGRLFLYVGRLSTDKGVLDLVEAFARVGTASDDVDLALLGDGPARDAVRRAATRLNMPVSLVGQKPLSEIPTWMAAADVVVLPSHHEGMPNVVVEALSCGRRVVATRVGAIPDLLYTEELGHVVEPHDVIALADALARAARTDYDAAEVARRADCKSWDDSARLLFAALERARAGSVRVAERRAA